MVTMVWWLVVIVVLVYGLYVERIVAAEERFLAARFGADDAAWASRTPALCPRIRNWRAPARHCSLRMVLRREYNGLMTIALTYLTLEALLDLVIEGEPLTVWLDSERGWLLLFAIALPAVLVLRLLKKRTRLLRVPDGSPA